MVGKRKLTKKKCGLSFLKILLRLHPHERACLIGHLNDSSINQIGHLVFNSLWTDLGIPAKKAKNLAGRLKAHRRDLEFISNPENSINDRRKKVQKQSASGLGILLASVVPALISLLAK